MSLAETCRCGHLLYRHANPDLAAAAWWRRCEVRGCRCRDYKRQPRGSASGAL